MAYPGGAPVTIVGGRNGGAAAGTAANPVVTSDSNKTYTLASNATLAANGTTTPVTGIQAGSYIFAYQFGGTTPSLILESLGPDGTNYQTMTTVTASDTKGVVIGENATVRLRNGTANPITNLSANLS